MAKKAVGVADVIGYLCKVIFYLSNQGLYKPYTSIIKLKELHHLYHDNLPKSHINTQNHQANCLKYQSYHSVIFTGRYGRNDCRKNAVGKAKGRIY